MNIFGLTGGIASGKTTIINFLKKKKFAVHESDQIVNNLYSAPNKKFLNHLKKNSFSNAINKKKINKKIVREEIFNNNNKRKKVESFIHNEVKKSRKEFLKKNQKIKTKIVILDIPLLFEAKLTNICDYIILLHAPKKLRVNRALKRKGMKKKILLKILQHQLSDAHKKKKSNFIIDTSKTKNYCFNKILKILENIKKNGT